MRAAATGAACCWSGVDLCRRWPGMEMLYKLLMGETVDGVITFAILHYVTTGVAQ